MKDGDERELQARQVLTMRLINGALISGVAFFFGVAIIIRTSQGGLLGPRPTDLSSPLVLVGIVLSVGAVALRTLMPRWTALAMRRAIAEGRGPTMPGATGPGSLRSQLLAGLQTQKIVRLALLEGAAFFNLIVFLLEGNLISLALAGVLTVLMLLEFPTEGQVDSWVEDQAALLQQEGGPGLN